MAPLHIKCGYFNACWLGTVAVDVWRQFFYRKYLLWNGSGKTNCYRSSTLVLPCSNNSVLLASRCRSIYITVKKRNLFLKAFILETGMIIAVPDPDSKKIFFHTDPTLLTLPIFKKEENRSLTSTGSGFEKKISYGSKQWLLYVGDFQNKPVFQRKFFVRSNTYCINK
jgi:hypothetical protein